MTGDRPAKDQAGGVSTAESGPDERERERERGVEWARGKGS